MLDEITPEVTLVAGGEPAAEAEKLGWKSELPESLRSNEVFAPYKTKNDLWNGHIDAVTKAKDLEGKLANAIPRLPDNATDEQRNAYYAALGRPDTADGYELPKVEGVEHAPEIDTAFKKFAFENGMPKDLAAKTSQWYDTLVGGLVKAQKEADASALEEATVNLTKEWGTDFNANAETVRKAFAAFGIPDDLANLEIPVGNKTVKFGNHPAIMKAFLNIGKKMLNDTVPPGSIAGSGEGWRDFYKNPGG